MQIAECGEEVSDWLEEKLLISLRDTNVQSENSNIVLAARESNHQIIGGLVGSTSYGWLLVKILWVDEHFRGSGVGRSLMESAELSAITSSGCHSAWLDTSSPAAHKFYLQLGYEAFGELRNHDDQNPPGHQRWFMRKTL